MNAKTSPPLLQDLLDLADACVLCGLCLPHCPTYRLEARETEGPRGRVMLVQALARGADADADISDALEHCLGCGRCEQVCPARVRFGELMRRARPLYARPPSASVRGLLWASRHPRLFASALRAVRPLRTLAGLRNERALEATQAPARGTLPSGSRAPSLRIGMLGGCVGEGLEARAQRAAETLLLAAGHLVLRPSGQACCGALDQHAGLGLHVDAQHERNRALWRAQAPDCLVTTMSGCQSAFAAGLSEIAPVQGIAGLLAADPAFAKLALRALPKRVALHLPCTQRGLQGEATATRELLARVPGLHWLELPDTGCCGAGGAHMLAFPQRAALLRAPLVDAIVASGATTLASANIGCRLHLGGAVELAGVELRHPLELLAEALP